MCGGHGCGHDMARAAFFALDLKPGDEVVIKPGHGDPAAEQDRTEKIYDVYDASALTCEGTRLMCTDAVGLFKTGRQNPVKPSAAALQVLDEVGMPRPD